MRITFGFFTIILLMGCFSFALKGTFQQLQQHVPISQLLEKNIHQHALEMNQTSFIKDQNGHVISEIYGAENRIYLPYSDIPTYVKHAFIATEDRHFFIHKGFDVLGIARAFVVNAENSSIEQGGSTITQQLVRNIYLNNEKNYNRKLKEILYAHQLEKELSKEKIMELYINNIYFHNQAYGIEAAARYYFSQSVQQLSLAETAFLCAIPNNPSYYDPLLHFEHTKSRQQFILKRMLEEHFIEKEEYEKAIRENIQLLIKEKVDEYPNYVSYIYEELKQLLAQQLGYSQLLQQSFITSAEKNTINEELNVTVDRLLKSGVTIETALDIKIQKIAETELEDKLGNSIIEGAVVVIDHQTHEIKAIVGGKNYKKHNFHRAFQAYRQPGSAMKPLLVYGPYFAEFGSSTKSTVSIGPYCKDGYCPRNANGNKYGSASLETALKYSYNTAAIRLFEKTGIEKSFSYLKPFQFSKVVQADHRLPAAIGGFTYGVTPLELTNAYTIFSNDGKYTPSHAIRSVLDKDGNLLYQWNNSFAMEKVWDEKTNNKMRNLLHQVITEGTGKNAFYHTSSYLGGKTGTTNDYKDLWFIGYNEKYTTGIWIGSDQPSSMENFSKRTPHLFIWKNIMSAIDHK